MKSIIRKAKALLLAHYAHMLEYRSEIFLWALAGSLPIILMGVWLKASDSGNFALNSIDFARYFFSVFLVRQFTNIWVIWDFEREVVEGKLSLKLLQPIDPAWHHLARHVSEKLTRIPLVIILIGLFFWLYPQAFWFPSLATLLTWIVIITIAFSLRFLIQYTFAMLTFWTERASAILQFWLLFYIFFSGLIAPLEVFPLLMREIILWTPFPYFLYFPAALLVGLPVDFTRALLTTIGWGLIFYLLNRWLWKQGLKQYSGMGA